MFDINPKLFNEDNYTKKLWGHKFTLGTNPHYRVDLLEIKKSGFCSWHYHYREFNKFVVLEGILALYVKHSNGIKCYALGPKESMTYYTVRPGDKHIFYARTDVQCIELIYAVATKHDITRIFPGGIGESEKNIRQELE